MVTPLLLLLTLTTLIQPTLSLTCNFCMLTKLGGSANVETVELSKSNDTDLVLTSSDIEEVPANDTCTRRLLKKELDCYVLGNNLTITRPEQYELSEGDTMTITCQDLYVNGKSGLRTKTYTCNTDSWNEKRNDDGTQKKNMWKTRKDFTPTRPWCTGIGAMEKVYDIWSTVSANGSSTDSALNAIMMTHYLNYDGTSEASQRYGFYKTGLYTAWIQRPNDDPQQTKNTTLLYDNLNMETRSKFHSSIAFVLLECDSTKCLTYKAYSGYNHSAAIIEYEERTGYDLDLVRQELCDNETFSDAVTECPSSSNIKSTSPKHTCRVKSCNDRWHCENYSDMPSTCTNTTCNIQREDFNQTITTWTTSDSVTNTSASYQVEQSCNNTARMICIDPYKNDSVDAIDFKQLCDSHNDCEYADTVGGTNDGWSADEAVCISTTEIFEYKGIQSILTLTREQLCSDSLYELIQSALRGGLDEGGLGDDLARDYITTCTDPELVDMFTTSAVQARLCGAMFGKECPLSHTRYKAQSFRWNTAVRPGFECSSNEIVPLYLVCNGVQDCTNTEDEMYCSNRSMCYDTWTPHADLLKPIVSYTAKDQCDRVRQCGNGADECHSDCSYDAFSDGKKMITSVGLVVWLLLLGVLAILLNLAMIIEIIVKSYGAGLSGLLMLNRYFLLNIGLGGLLMGIYLMIIMMKYITELTSTSSNECWDDKAWAASDLCEVAGVINIMSLTVSLSSLCVLALLRCYVIYLEYAALDFDMWKVVIIGFVGTMVIWVPSVLFALLPLSPHLEDIFVTKRFHQYNGWFYGDGTKQRYQSIIEGLTNTKISGNLTWKEIEGNISERLFVSNNTIIGSPISYFSESALCVPSFLPPLQGYTVIVLVYFLLLCVTQITGYSLIMMKAKLVRYNSSEKGGQSQARKKMERRHQNNTVLMCLTTVLTIGLISLVTIISYLVDDGTGTSKETQSFYALLACAVLPINSVLNPLIYSAKDMPIERWEKLCGVAEEEEVQHTLMVDLDREG